MASRMMRVVILGAAILAASFALPNEAAASCRPGWVKINNYGACRAKPELRCQPGWEKNGALCYPKCEHGFKGAGPVCWQATCPPGFRNDPAHCAKPAPYGRGTGYVLWHKARCFQRHGSCEKHGLIWYPKCRAGFRNIGCCICSPKCPWGMLDIGVSCAKKSYGRGAGKPPPSIKERLLPRAWRVVPGGLKQVSAGSDHHIWGVSRDGSIWRRQGAKWVRVPGSLTNVSVGFDGTVWGVNAAGSIFRRESGGWKLMPGKLKQISVGSQKHVWGVAQDDSIWRWTCGGWARVPGRLSNISAGSGGTVWGVNAAGQVFRRESSTWKLKRGKLKQIAVGHGSLIVGVDRSGQLWMWEDAEQYDCVRAVERQCAAQGRAWCVEQRGACKGYWKRHLATLQWVAVTPSGRLWGVDSTDTIYRTRSYNSSSAQEIPVVGGPEVAVAVAKPSRKKPLERGESLAAGDRLTSANGRFFLTLQRDGNAVICDRGQGKRLWASGTSTKRTPRALLTSGGPRPGMFVVLGQTRNFLTPPGGNRLVMGDDGNLVLYTADGRVTWASDTAVGTGGAAARRMAATAGRTAAGSVSGNAPVNLARGKPATQSSVGWGGDAIRAVDGNTSGVFGRRSTTHTKLENGAWWQVDLGRIERIDEIRLFNRIDCCSERLSNFEVLVSNRPLAGGSPGAAAQITWRQVHRGRVGRSVSFKVGSSGRYVRVQLLGRNYLSLAEVQVLGPGR